MKHSRFWHTDMLQVVGILITSLSYASKLWNITPHYLRIVQSREWWILRSDLRNCLCRVFMSLTIISHFKVISPFPLTGDSLSSSRLSGTEFTTFRRSFVGLGVGPHHRSDMNDHTTIFKTQDHWIHHTQAGMMVVVNHVTTVGRQCM
jgi:hypothetical protein